MEEITYHSVEDIQTKMQELENEKITILEEVDPKLTRIKVIDLQLKQLSRAFWKARG